MAAGLALITVVLAGACGGDGHEARRRTSTSTSTSTTTTTITTGATVTTPTGATASPTPVPGAAATGGGSAGRAGATPGGAAPTGTATVAAPATTVPAPTTAADQAKARSLVLELSDLPRGWTAAPHERGPDDEAEARALAACMGAPDPATTETAHIDGADFRRPDSLISSYAAFYRTVADAEAFRAALASPKYIPCAQESATKDLQAELNNSAPGSRVESLTVRRLQPGEYGNPTAVFRAEASIARPGQQSVRVYLDYAYLLKERAKVNVSFQRPREPVETDVERSAIQKLGAKLEKI